MGRPRNMCKDKITIRVTPNQQQVLKDLTGSLNVSQSLLIRTIIGDFITRNEDVLDRIITGKQTINIDELI